MWQAIYKTFSFHCLLPDQSSCDSILVAMTKTSDKKQLWPRRNGLFWLTIQWVTFYHGREAAHNILVLSGQEVGLDYKTSRPIHRELLPPAKFLKVTTFLNSNNNWRVCDQTDELWDTFHIQTEKVMTLAVLASVASNKLFLRSMNNWVFSIIYRIHNGRTYCWWDHKPDIVYTPPKEVQQTSDTLVHVVKNVQLSLWWHFFF